MKYNKENGRKNMRLQGYDYSRSGLYFITIVLQNHAHLFGHIEDGKMILNPAGQMIEKWYYEIENKFPDKRLHEMQVMPNHFHCIIENLDMNVISRGEITMGENATDGNATDGISSGAISTDGISTDGISSGAHVGAPLRGRPDSNIDNIKFGATIGDVMDWFKTMTTNEYIRGVKNHGWKHFFVKLWQRNFYDHIIRNQQDYENIVNYIKNNPANWDNDKLYIN